MYLFNTDGLKHTDVSPKDTVPIFLDEDFRVIEGPSYWAIELAQKRSRSIETLKQYTTVLARFLQWRDDKGIKAMSWQLTDEDVINAYIGYLINNRDFEGRPSNKTIEDYIATLRYFFKWATEKGYRHYWNMELKKITVQIQGSSAMVKTKIQVEKRTRIGNGSTTHVARERDKFIHRENIPKIIELIDDVVYAFIVIVLWKTALRPKELFQLPYMGTGLNAGLKRYRDEELSDLKEILFRFESKGKDRDIKFPPDVWSIICRKWMPERVKRAARYQERNNGKMPPNNALFLSENGTVVTPKMLRDNFNKVAKDPRCPEKKITPYMFRHAFATYFVLDRLKQYNSLGKAYVYNAVIDAELREWMGHENIDTTYKYYVHLVNRYFHNGLLDVLDDPVNKEIFEAFEKLYF
ncbi:tyrosine-type recombinase/integrase [Cytobacillus solani]|uniref:Recombinase XerD n=1 Tax=Cytobacillus solani TaxID=1637975 RepID=A0A0Q3VHG6_9BACI|nr:site-specific integrase [Cytobacillus solani]KQL19079.1 recombinase XerD [Cytobacillus solani]